jgi:NTE family protein
MKSCFKTVTLTLFLSVLLPVASQAAGSAGTDPGIETTDTRKPGNESAGTPVSERPRIGLVLGGGGARGAAHVGVLKFLEEHRIPVDFVVGTSMGALAGGLYASGMSAREIEKMTREMNWQEMFSDDLPPDELPIRRKREGYQYLVDVEAGYRDGNVVFPTGFLSGQRLKLLLSERTLPVRHIQDFDDLPTQFRALATNLATAEGFVFESGDLATAMRASMSVPGVFSPVSHDGRKLVDGGLVENLPIPTARELQPDILIVVDVTTPLYDVDTLASPFDVTTQVINGVMLNQTRELRKLLGDNDILITPELDGLSAAAFDDIGEIIDQGYAAAEANRNALRALIASDPEFAVYERQRNSRREAIPFIRDIAIETSGHELDELVAARISQPLDAPLDTQVLHSDLQRLYGLQIFDTVDYRIEPAIDGSVAQGNDRLVIQSAPKETGPLRFELGFEMIENFDGDTAFELATAATLSNVNSYGAEWRSKLGLGEITGISTEFYQPLDYQGDWFVSTHYTNALENIFHSVESGEIARYRAHQNIFGLDVGYHLGFSSEVRAGWRRGYLDTSLREGDPALFPELDFSVGDAVFGYHLDTMDSFSFPSDGTRVDVRWMKSLRSLGASEDGEFVSLDALTAVNWFKDNLLLGLTMESVLSGERFISQGVRLGGMQRLSGFARDELVGQHAFLARAIYYRYLGRDPDRLIDLPLYAGVTLETGNVWQERSDAAVDDLITGGSAFIALDTFLGPVSLAYGMNSNGDDAFYLSIGTLNGPSFRQFDY